MKPATTADRTTGDMRRGISLRMFLPMGICLALLVFGVVMKGHAETKKTTATGSFYREPDSYSTRRDPDPPKYSRAAQDSRWAALSDWTWLDVGLDYRFRYEHRDDDIRRPVDGLDEPLLHRTRLYLGVHDLLDPFRFAFEMQDSRRHNGNFPIDNRDVNEFEVIRLYAELYFEDLLGRDPRGNARPLSARYGIHNFEFLDRRLIGNNQWRNTANTFQGFQAALGQEANDWHVDLLAVQPLERRLGEWDRPVDGQWVWAAIGHWRGWSEVVTLEPFYLALTDSTVANGGRQVHSPGLRAYGRIGDTGFDYDLDGVWQFGSNGALDVSAWAATGEVGYRWSLPWKPRLSAFYGQATGDADPNDGEDNRFERFFGFARPWSANDYIIFENIRAQKLRLELTPHEKVRLDAGYNWYWLDSATDRYLLNSIRDASGRSGRFLGHEWDIRCRWQVSRAMEIILGYAHFTPGDYVRNVIRPGDTDFAYIEINLNAF